jgi:hypothetical protein
VETESANVMRFPYPGAMKYRKGFDKIDGDPNSRKFWWDPPTAAGQVPFLPPGFEPGEHMLLLEGETDTMAAWQAATAAWKPHIVGLSGLNAWKDRYTEELFGKAKRVFVIFDNDDPYGNPIAAKANTGARAKIKLALGRKMRRVMLPQGSQDVAEFFQRYDWGAFRVLLQAAAAPIRHYPRLDLSKDPPPVQWLVDGLFPDGELMGLFAESGTGKSFLTAALMLSVAGGHKTWLGRKVARHGPVLYVDEENPADLVIQRLRAMGMTEREWGSIEYISQAGVNLFSEPTFLLEEAIDLEPALIVLGTLSSLSVGIKSENDNTEMTRVIREGIVPLARQTGAAVILEHHVGVEAGRARGATSIKQNVDGALMLTAAKSKNGIETGNLNLFPAKDRRRLRGLTCRIEGEVEDGKVRVVNTDASEGDDPF